MGRKRNSYAKDMRLKRQAGVKALAMVMIACIAMLEAGVCRASDAGGGFTLGSGALQPVTADIAGKNPGVVTAKYGFSLMKDFTPYIGTGVAYMLPEEASVTDTAQKLRTGVAGQAGVSVNLSSSSALVIDYKYLRLNNDLPNNGTQPQSVGIGVNIKF